VYIAAVLLVFFIGGIATKPSDTADMAKRIDAISSRKRQRVGHTDKE